MGTGSVDCTAELGHQVLISGLSISDGSRRFIKAHIIKVKKFHAQLLLVCLLFTSLAWCNPLVNAQTAWARAWLAAGGFESILKQKGIFEMKGGT